MTDKAYIVANKEQELEVLKNFEDEGLVWTRGQNPTEWLPSVMSDLVNFPYILIDYGVVRWLTMTQLVGDETIVYDGRKEDEMNNKYKVTQEFMNELIKWRDDERLNINTKGIGGSFLDIQHIEKLPDVVDIWWTVPDNKIENNNRLIAIIQWLNGEDVFEVEKPHKFVVRTERVGAGGNYSYVELFNNMALLTDYEHATAFDTREEAQEWANSHQVVVEIDEEGNEVE